LRKLFKCQHLKGKIEYRRSLESYRLLGFEPRFLRQGLEVLRGRIAGLASEFRHRWFACPHLAHGSIG